MKAYDELCNGLYELMTCEGESVKKENIRELLDKVYILEGSE